jgi:hypothetical protein
MAATATLEEYLVEIREQVCSRCIEKPPGGPPCGPLGKDCGVELHLPQLIDAIHQVQSPLLEPYLQHNRSEICEKCAFLHSSICPCPMDYLAALIVQAVETVDRRPQENSLAAPEWAEANQPVDIEGIRRAYYQAVGTWKGCDWPTYFGKTGLNLKGWTAMQAAAMAWETLDPDAVADWKGAAQWLVQVENLARQAEARATEALQAALAGHWEEALHKAESAWALEFSTGRPLRLGFPLTWQPLRQLIETATMARKEKPQ